MSDYTPETEKIKNSWANYIVTTDDVKGLWYDRGWPEEAFDRWLEEHDRQVAEKAWGQGATTNIISTVMNGSRGIPRNPYRKGEGSWNGASQSPVESSNLLNGEEQ